MTLASAVFKKTTFQMFQFLNALESKFDLDVKWVKGNPGSSFEKKLGRPYIPNVTYQVPRSSVFCPREEDF